MLTILNNILAISTSIIFLALLVFGLIQSKKHSFMAGFYFFLIMIFLLVAPYIYSPLLDTYLNYLMTSGKMPMELTFGQFIVWFNLLLKWLEIIAYSILIIGLYRMWLSRRTKS